MQLTKVVDHWESFSRTLQLTEEDKAWPLLPASLYHWK